MILSKIETSDNLKIDFIHIEEKTDNNDNIFANKQYIPVLNNNSKFLVKFEDGNTTSEGIEDLALGYTFSVYKKVGNSEELLYVAKINDGSLSLTDYNVVNNEKYIYYIFKESESSISEAVASNEVETCWQNWSITDLIPSDVDSNLFYTNDNLVWSLDLNLISSDESHNIASTTYNTLDRFPQVSTGNQLFDSGNISCLLGTLRQTGRNVIDYYEPASMLEEWKNFCLNGRYKLLKDRKGNSKVVKITSSSSKVLDETVQQPNTITFDWVQVDSSKNITIIGER